MTPEIIRMEILVIVALIVGFGGGWFAKGRFGAKAAAVKNIITE